MLSPVTGLTRPHSATADTVARTQLAQPVVIDDDDADMFTPRPENSELGVVPWVNPALP